MAFEDVPPAPDRQNDPPRRDEADVHDPKRPVEPDDEDREPHPERVYRRRVRKEQRFVSSKRGPEQEPSSPLAETGRNVAAQPNRSRPVDYRRPHRR